MSDRKKLGNRIAKLRKKVNPTDDERKQIADWDASKKAAGRPRADAETPGDVYEPEVIPLDPELAGKRLGEGAPPPDPPPAPDSSYHPPRDGGRRGNDWRDKYRSRSMGREGACVQVAMFYCSWMITMNKAITEFGGEPAFDDESVKTMLFPAAVLTADKLLPEKVDMSPEILVTAATAATVTKRVYYGYKATKASEAKRKADERANRFVRPPQPVNANRDTTGSRATVESEAGTGNRESAKPSERSEVPSKGGYVVKPDDPI